LHRHYVLVAVQVSPITLHLLNTNYHLPITISPPAAERTAITIALGILP
jgi:hypothetical protein